jgi:hypothetical protein
MVCQRGCEGDVPAGFNGDRVLAEEVAVSEIGEVMIAGLKPLSDQQVKGFLTGAFSVASQDAAAAFEFARNLGLTFALHSPGDLKWFARLLGESPRPSSRSDAFTLASRHMATARSEEMVVSVDDMVQEISRLCAAVVFCGIPNFTLVGKKPQRLYCRSESYSRIARQAFNMH